jgi:hypothetical protein
MDRMNITAARYVVDTISGDNASVRTVVGGQEMSVPMDPANRHYEEIMRQVEAGTLVILAAE